jgi:hypothetical protein
VDLVIAVAGVLGLAVAGYAFVSLWVDAVRRRRPLEAVLAVAVVAVTVWLLVAYGDRLLR